VSRVEPDPEEGGDPPCWAAQFDVPDERDADDGAEGADDVS
jgi:hypothetical protein